MTTRATVMAGVPAINKSLYRRMKFNVLDPAALIEFSAGGKTRRVLLIRDIEVTRARQSAAADGVYSPADFTPDTGLSADRETAIAQATAECLRRAGVKEVVADRTLPLIYAEMIRAAGVAVVLDAGMGVSDRRQKSAEEITFLRQAQADTEAVIREACEIVAKCNVNTVGELFLKGNRLTTDRLRGMIDVSLMQRGYENPISIVAGGPVGADCHHHGAGNLRVSEPIVIDIFPCNRVTRYNGDCTRTVVNGPIPPLVVAMHEAVVHAKREAIAAVKAGITGDAVHAAACAVIDGYGYIIGVPPEGIDPSLAHMPHGTGHGIGLDVHEPPLLNKGGPALLAGDALTIEPGLYAVGTGGVRVEDMVIVTETGCDNLNTLPEGLSWK